MFFFIGDRAGVRSLSQLKTSNQNSDSVALSLQPHQRTTNWRLATMVPTNLQGLNIVQPQKPHNPNFSDSQDLLSVPSYPDLAAQLDLWTNLAFESDEPLPRDEENFLSRKKKKDTEDEENLNPAHGVAFHDSHENVVTGTTLPMARNGPTNTNFDLNQFLTGIGIDPYSSPQNASSKLGGVPSLVQLLSLYPQNAGTNVPSTIHNTTLPPRATQGSPSQPPAKRARSRSRASVSTEESPITPIESSSGEGLDNEFGSVNAISAAEDKRRRNTAASARFRMKKKEREAALEKKAKDLEGRVNELERECEGLRRENGWLKGLVVGVTGAQPVSTGKKRSRAELDAGSVSLSAK